MRFWASGADYNRIKPGDPLLVVRLNMTLPQGEGTAGLRDLEWNRRASLCVTCSSDACALMKMALSRESRSSAVNARPPVVVIVGRLGLVVEHHPQSILVEDVGVVVVAEDANNAGEALHLSGITGFGNIPES